MPSLALQDKKGFSSVVREDALKKWITDSYDPADLWAVDYLIMNILSEATTEQLQFIQAVIAGEV